MKTKIEEAASAFSSEIKEVKSLKELEVIKIKYLSRKGLMASLFEEFKSLPPSEKPAAGNFLNKIKTDIQNKIDEFALTFDSGSKTSDRIDLSLPARKVETGTYHLITQTLEEVKRIFKGLGFSVEDGPELESDYNNFEALNFPDDHPARDMQDTFFVNSKFVMRTHTSPVQIRLMNSKKPPLRAIMPGKVYRNESISAKSYCLFHQVEGLYVDKDVTFAELKGTLVSFIKQLYGDDIVYRFRSSFFPFTEPSAEVDIWMKPTADKPGRWMEILGCGMVDPNVLKNVNIDPEVYTGYAFGMGVERMAMRKYGINDIRTIFDNDKRFLTQF